MSPRFLADENIDLDLVLGPRRRVDGVDIVRVQDVGLRTADDPTIWQWAADHGRVLVSHDLRTIPGFVGERLSAGQSMPGVILLQATVSIATAIDELALVAMATRADEWVDQVAYLPLRQAQPAHVPGSSARPVSRCRWCRPIGCVSVG